MTIPRKIQLYFISFLMVTSIFGSSLIGIDLGFAKLSPYRILGLLLSVVLLVSAVRFFLKKQYSKKVDWVVVFFLGWFTYALLSYFWVSDKSAWFRAIFFLWVGFSAVIGLRLVVIDRKSFHYVLNTIVLMVIVVTVLGWIELIFKTSLFSTVSDMKFSFYSYRSIPVLWFYNPNNLAFFLCISFFFMYLKLKNTQQLIVKLLIALSIMLQFRLLLQTQSRAGILGLCTGLSILLVYHFIELLRGRKKAILYLICLIVFSLIIPLPKMASNKSNYSTPIGQILKLISDSFNIRLSSDKKHGETTDWTDEQINGSFSPEETFKPDKIEPIEGSDSIRVNLIRNSIEVFLRSKFIGSGSGNLEKKLLEPDLPRDTKGYANAHNFWIEILATYGIIIFIPMLLIFVIYGIRFLIFAFVKKMYYERNLAIGMVACMGSFILASISPSSILNIELLWPIVGLVIASYGLLCSKASYGEKNAPKKLLIIAYYFAPENKIASIRPTKLAKYLQRMGYQVKIICSEPRILLEDKNLAKDMQEMDIVRIPFSKITLWLYHKIAGKPYYIYAQFNNSIPETGARRNGMSTVRRLLARFFDIWNERNFTNRTLSYLHQKDERYDTVFSTFGPLCCLTIGYLIKEEGIAGKWIADYRDPLRQSFAQRFKPFHQYIQKRVFEVADQVTVVSEGLKNEWLSTYGPSYVLTNGFDEEDIHRSPHCVPLEDGGLKIVYAGNLYASQSDCRPVFRALAELKTKINLQDKDVQFHYAGRQGDEIREQAKAYGFETIIIDHGFLPREEVLTLFQQCDVTVVLSWNNPGYTGVLTGKLFELLMLNKPIIACVSGSLPDSEICGIIRHTGSGVCYEEANQEKDYPVLLSNLQSLLILKKSGMAIVSDGNRNSIQEYSYQNISKKLAEMI